MSRPLRIEYPGAWYHVMSRGRRAEKVFLDREDYQSFIDLLKEACELWKVNVSAFSLMPNHYHLLINTPLGNLSRFMRHVNGVYTQRFNKNHGTEGQVFKGRYKSILVDGQGYLLELVRYIHRNPLRSNIVKNIADYRWSSHRGYFSDSEEGAWLYKEFILSNFSEDIKEAISYYKDFVSQVDNKKIVDILDNTIWPAMVGSDEFVSYIRGKFYRDKIDRDIPQSEILTPEYDDIKEEVCSCFRIHKEELLRSRRKHKNLPRDIAIYLSRILKRDPLDRIGWEFGLNRYSSVSSVLSRTRERLRMDKELGILVDKIKNKMINKSQS